MLLKFKSCLKYVYNYYMKKSLFKLACEWNLPENMIPWIPYNCTVCKNQIQPYYSNKLLKCVIVKIHSDTKPQKFDASYKRKSKLSRQINQLGSAKSDQSDSFSWQQRSRFEGSVIDEKQDSLITKEGYSTMMYFIIRTTWAD